MNQQQGFIGNTINDIKIIRLYYNQIIIHLRQLEYFYYQLKIHKMFWCF